jgi:hypothetical protein
LEKVESDPVDVIVEKADGTSRDINRITRKSTVNRTQITVMSDFYFSFYDLRENPTERSNITTSTELKRKREVKQPYQKQKTVERDVKVKIFYLPFRL